MSEKGKEEFSFIEEQIKSKPINKKKLLLQIAKTAGLAVVFGVVACLVFTMLQPTMQGWFAQENKPTVTFPKDEQLEDLETETQTEQPTEITEPTEAETTESTDTSSEIDSTEGGFDPVVPTELSLEEYQILQNKLYAVGRDVNHSIVTVTGVKSDTDWFNTAYEKEGQASGVIIANNGQELLIMTEKKVITDADSITVTFYNEAVADAALKKYDGNTGITILSVPLSEIDDTTLATVKAATLGNSMQVIQGTLVIALGSPLGSNFSILTGNVTSTDNSITTLDSTYKVFTTDIVGSASGSGVLINLQGEIVGLVMQDYSNEGDENTLTALAISPLKNVIEMLSNGEDIPYLGLKVSTVTSDIAEEYNLPLGVYIKTVAMDSPALAAGLQNGDVITAIGDVDVKSAQTYQDTVNGLGIGDTVDVEIRRQGVEGYSKFTCPVEVGILK